MPRALANWKEVARQAWARTVAFPYEEPLPLLRYVIVRMPNWPVAEVTGPKGIREFMWDNRKSRQMVRDRAVVWKRTTAEGKVQVGLGAWTSPDLPSQRVGRRFEIVETD